MDSYKSYLTTKAAAIHWSPLVPIPSKGEFDVQNNIRFGRASHYPPPYIGVSLVKSGGCCAADADPLESTEGDALLFVELEESAPKEPNFSIGLFLPLCSCSVTPPPPLSPLPGEAPLERTVVVVVVLLLPLDTVVVVVVVVPSLACRS